MFVPLILVAIAGVVSGSQDLMMDLTVQFVKPLEACKKEMDMSENVLKDLLYFWKEDYEFIDKDTGCVMLCMSKKLELVDDEHNLHHGNAKDFAQKHGADETKANQLVDLIHGCIQSVPNVPDVCEKALNVAKCFRTEIHKLNWAPDLELVTAEIMNEVSWKA